MKFVVLYLLAVNLVGTVITVYDKLAAKYQMRRISERCLFLYAIFGGAPLMYMAMKAIRHKTLHKNFMIGFPVIMVLQIFIYAFLIYKFA